MRADREKGGVGDKREREEVAVEEGDDAWEGQRWRYRAFPSVSWNMYIGVLGERAK